ncbi:MAG: threonine synthase [Turicibacter sp.]|nr:threonine synthase [Turicibacter sp.]
MQYFSTRDPQKKTISASEAIVKGLAPDGGLYVPTAFPSLTDFIGKPYNELALEVLKRYLTDFSEAELATCIEQAYKKYNPVKLNGHYLELFHGATLAFKDVALQLFPYLLTTALAKNNVDKTAVILAATSGDTGSAVLSGIADVPKTKAIVFYPENGVSSVQRLQMTTKTGDNVHVFGIKGNFDDAQTGVKEIFSDDTFKNQFSDDYFFTSANSINLGRLLPQVVYYFYCYSQLVEQGKVARDEKVNFVVPTGNFGNILAGYYAKQMGLPIHKLICATNKNDVLDEFFKTGVYNHEGRDFHLTLSPSMDILISSNLERLTYEDRDLSLFDSGSATDDETMATIKAVYETDGYLLDPHTAVAKYVYDQYRAKTGDETFTVIVSTAAPHKFPEAVACAVGENQLTDVPEQIADLDQLPVLHPGVVDDLKAAVAGVLG